MTPTDVVLILKELHSKPMKQPDSIKIDEVEYVRKDTLSGISTAPKAIIVVAKGFVYVGEVSYPSDDKEFLHITNAHNIRYWGTTKGLGELCTDGPTKTTKLDFAGNLVVPKHAVISIHSINQKAWKI